MAKKRIFLSIILLFIGLHLFGADDFTGWRQTETKHFTIIYEERDRASVEELLEFCEDVYEQVTAYFDSYPEKIRCVINGRMDIANGYYQPIQPHLSLWTASPSFPWHGTKTKNWFRYLFIHELTHYVHNSYTKGMTGFWSALMGPGFSALHLLRYPGWMVEGITTNIETRYTDGGRGRSAFFEMEYKALIMENDFYTFYEAGGISINPPRAALYVAGYVMIDYLMDNYGEESFADIVEVVNEKNLSVDAACKEVTGITLLQLYEDTKKNLTKKYASDLLIQEGALVSPPVAGHFHLPLPTDNGWIGYRYDPRKNSAIVKIDESSQNETLLVETSLSDEYSLAVDKTGNSIIYSKMSLKSHPAGDYYVTDLWEFDQTENVERRLTYDKGLRQPALSPDGETLLAVQRQGSFSVLVEVDAESGNVSPLFSESNSNIYTPAFSPSGEKVVFTYSQNGIADLYVLDLNNRQTQLVSGINDSGEYLGRFISEDKLVFSSDKDGSLKLYLKNLADGSIHLIADDPVGAFAGFFDSEDNLIYASYSARGRCYKRKTPDRLLAETAVFEVQDVPPYEPERGDIQNEKGFVHTPEFSVVIPGYLPKYTDQSVFIGLGGNLLGYSISDASMQGSPIVWQNFTYFFPQNLQVVNRFAASFDLGYVTLGFSSTIDFDDTVSGSTVTYEQTGNEGIYIDVPLFRDYDYPESTAVNLVIEGRHCFVLSGTTAFPFFNGFDLSSLDLYQELITRAAVRWDWAYKPAAKGYLSPWKMSAFGSVAYVPPVLDVSADDFKFFTDFFLFGRGALDDYTFFEGFLYVGYKEADIKTYFLKKARGWKKEPIPGGRKGIFLAGLDQPMIIAQIPVSMLEYPLMATVFLEKEIGFDGSEGFVTMDDYYYTGLGIRFVAPGVSLEAGCSIKFGSDKTRILYLPEDYYRFYVNLNGM